MKPEDNSLESGSEASQYNSSLEGGYQTSNAPNIPIKSPKVSISLFKFNKLAILITVSTLLFIGLLGGGAFIYDKTHSKASSLNSLEASGTYKNGSTLAVNQAQQADLLTLGQVNQLSVNGQLTVNKTLVLTPSTTPTSPIAGEIYFDSTTNKPYVYNGSQFVSLQIPAQYVANVGGITGNIVLGNGLTINGNTVNVSNSLLQSISSAASSTSVVSSLQGATGNVTLSSGSGISINGTTVSNTGVLNLTSLNGSIVITNSGSGSYNLALSGGGGVILGPNAAQIDNSNNPSIYINKTNNGNLLELQNNGVDQFVVNQSGNLGINGSFTQNGTGTFSTGSGAVSLNGNTTITGGNSLTVSSGATTLRGTLGVTGVSTLGSLGVSSFSDSGAASVTGNTSLTGTLSVQGAVTLGSNSPATQGSLIFDNGTNNNVISIVPSVPTGSGDVSVEFPALTGGSSDYFCVTGPDANCGTSATTVTTSSSGTSGDIAEFTGANQIANSPITDNGSNALTIQSGYTLNVGTLASVGDLNITPSGKVNINDTAQEVEIQGNASSYFSVSANGKTNKLAFTSPTSAQPTNYTITVPDESGTICLDNDAANCGFATSGSGVTDVNGYTGVICIQDANDNGSCSGNNVTINNATSSALGIASFSSTDFNVSSGAVTTVQNISTSGDVQFDGLSLGSGYNCTAPETGSLCLSTGGTVYTSNIVNPSSTAPLQVTSANSIFQFDQEGTTFEFPTGYGNTTHDICVSGVSCATGTGAAVILQPSSAQADDGSIAGIFINDINSNCTLGTNCKDLVDLQNGGSDVFTVDQYGNAQFDQTLYANTIQPISGAGGITVGTSGTSQTFTLQGNSGSENRVTNPNGGVSYIGIENPSGGTASSQSVYYALDDTQAPSSGTNGGNAAANPIFICTSANSYCTASSGITGTGTTGDLPLFNGAHSLANSILSQSSSNIAIAGSSSTSSLTIGNISSTAGQLVFNNGINSNSITFTQPASQPSSAINIGLPSVAGTVAVKGTGPISVDNTGTISCSDCAVTGSGGSGANVVTTLNGLDNAVSITDSLNNAFSTSGQNVQIANASTSNLGLVKINNDGNLTVSSGVVDTAQNIQTSSSPQFASVYLGSAGPSGNDGQLVFYDGSTGYKLTLNQLTLTNNQTIHIPNNSGTLIVAVGSSNNLTLNNGVVDTANAVNFPTSVTTAELLSGSSSLQIGSTSSVQPFTLNGTAGTSGSYSSLDLYSGTYNTKIDFAVPATGNNVYTFPDAGGISATVCLQNTGSSYNSCTYGSGLNGIGSSNQVAYFSGTGTLSSATNFYDNGSTVGLGGVSSGFGTHTQLTVNTNATAVNSAVTQLNSGTSNPTYIPLVVEGASSQTADLLDIDSNAGTPLAGFNSTGNLYFSGSSNNTITGASNENLTLQSQGAGQLLLNSAGSSLALQVGGTTEATVSSAGNFNLLNGSYQLGGSTTLSSAALTFTASTDSITGPSGSSITLDTTGSGILYLGNTNAPNIYLGNGNSTTTVAGQLSQSYSSPSASTADTIGFTNSNSAAGVAIQGISLTPANTTPSSGTNTLNVLNFVAGSGTNATAITNGVNFASSTGYSNFINAPNFVVGSNGVITLGTVGTTEGELTLNSSHSGGSFSIEPSVNQAKSTILYLPTDSSSTDTVCLVSDCTGAGAGSGDSSYIYNTYSSQQSPGNIDIESAVGYVAASIQGASGQDIMDLYSNGGTLVAHFDSSGNLSAGTINGATITSTAFDGATLSGGSLSGSSLSATQLLFSGVTGTVTTNSGDNLTIDTGGGTSTLNLGNAYATTIQIGNTTLSSGTQTINIGNNNTSGGTTNVNIGNGSTALGTVAIQGGNITLTTVGSGTTTISNIYNNTGTGTALKDNASDIQSGSSGSSTVNADTISLTGNATSGETINLNGINFANVSAIANNTFNGLYFGTGYNNAIQGVGSLNITGAGASTWDIGANTLSLQTLSGGAITTGTGLFTLGGNVALSAAAPSIYSSTTNSGLTLQANGTGALTLNSSGTTGTIGAIQIGNASTASVTQSINIGNNAGASSVSTVTVGSVLGASALTLQAGTGNLALTTGSTGGSNITLTTDYASSKIIAKSTINSITAFQIQGSSSTVLTADTTNSRLGVDNSYTQISTPASAPTVNGPYAGGSLTYPNTYYYEITAVDSMGGETTPSSQGASGTQTSSANRTYTITWSAVSGASAYKIYRCYGTSGCTEVYIASTSTTSYTDNGVTAGTAIPPTTNTAYVSTNSSNNNGQVTIGGNGTPTGQLYVSGTVPSTLTGATGYNISNPISTYVSGHYAYTISNGNSELVIDDISNPASPTYISEIGTNISGGRYVYVSGHYAYVVCGGTTGELIIFDISNPFSPAYVSETTTNLNTPNDIYVQGNYAYVTSGTNGTNSDLVIFNISNAFNPAYVSEISTNLNTPKTVYIQGNYAYITSYGSGYLVIDNISNPANPTYVGETNSNLDGPWGLFVSGSYAYIGEATLGYLVIDNISNPANPTYITKTSTNINYPVSVYVQGRYAYIANNEGNSMSIDDISNPYNPISVGLTVSNLSYPSGVFISGRYAYVDSSNNNSLVIYDLGGTYDQQLQAGGAELGTLQVDGNSIMSGDASVQGGLAVGSNAQIQGGLSVAGSSTLGSLSLSGLATPAAPTETVTCSGTCATSYNYAVAAINVSGVTAASASTSTGATANASLNTTTEYNRTGWTAVTGATGYNIYRTAGGAAQGLIGTVPASSITAPTPTSGSETGATLTLNYSIPPPFVIGQAITLAGFTMNTGSVNGTWPILSVTSSAITINILSGVTSTISTMGTATGILGFYDTAQTAGTSAPTTTTAGSLTVNGPGLFENASNSTTAFQVQNASGYTLLGVDTTSADNDVIIGQSSNLTGNLIFANASNSYTFSLTASTAASGNISLILPSVAPSAGQCLTATSSTQLAFAGCGTSHAKQITLAAEYAGAVLDSAGDSSCSSANVGTMTSGYNDTDSTPQSYYQWSTVQSSARCYDVVVQIPIPSDWSSWTGTPTIYASAGTGGSIAIAAIASNGTEESNYGTMSAGVAAYHSETTTGSLATVTLQGLTSASDSANGVLTLKIRMSATSSGNTEIGTIIIPYTSAY